MKHKPFKYFTVNTRSVTNVFEFTCMDDLKRFAESNAIKDVFVLQGNDGAPEYFALLHNNNVLQHSTGGYKTIEDHDASREGMFPDAAAYYEATAAGYTRYPDHLLVTTAGITDKAVFEQLVTAGFADGFAQCTNEAVTFLPPSVTNALELCNHATAKGFTTFNTFYDAMQHGFETNEEYCMARAAGFPCKADLDEARAKGFTSFELLEAGRRLQVRDVADLVTFHNLISLKCSGKSIPDQLVFLSFLSKLHEGTVAHISKLLPAFHEELNTYRYADTKELPKWMSTSLCDENSVINFLQMSEDANRFGTYNEDTQQYTVNHIKDRKVVIDGSNVAHNSHGNKDSIPYYDNIIRMVDYLKEKGINDITVYADATLKHKAEDKQNLDKLTKLVDYHECGAETSADTFLINFVKKHRCLLVTNDNFSDWKLSDIWVDKNIDSYALRFRIYPGHVSIRDLEEAVVS